MTRVLIIEEVGLVSQCLRHVLEGESDIEVVGTADSVESAMTALNDDVDIALVNCNLSDNGAATLLRQVRDNERNTKIIVSNLPDCEQAVVRYIEQGAAGYVTHDASVSDVLQTIRAVSEDEALLSPRVAASLMARVATLTQLRGAPYVDSGALDTLTSREHEVLVLIRRGMSNSEIADELIIELGTVKNHVHSILKKLGVSSRRSAAAMLPEPVDTPIVTEITIPAPIRRSPMPQNPTYALLESQSLAATAS
jgi:two-component system, NarL family, nitrate/nitrite response regulator NarL